MIFWIEVLLTALLSIAVLILILSALANLILTILEVRERRRRRRAIIELETALLRHIDEELDHKIKEKQEEAKE